MWIVETRYREEADIITDINHVQLTRDVDSVYCNAGSASQTIGQHHNATGSTSRVCMGALIYINLYIIFILVIVLCFFLFSIASL